MIKTFCLFKSCKNIFCGCGLSYLYSRVQLLLNPAADPGSSSNKRVKACSISFKTPVCRIQWCLAVIAVPSCGPQLLLLSMKEDLWWLQKT